MTIQIAFAQVSPRINTLTPGPSLQIGRSRAPWNSQTMSTAKLPRFQGCPSSSVLMARLRYLKKKGRLNG